MSGSRLFTPPPRRNLLAIRANGNLDITSLSGKKRKRKTAALADENIDPNVAAIFEEKCTVIESNRPIAKVTQRSVNGSPMVVETPGKSELNLSGNYGSVRCYSNSPFVPACEVKSSIDEKDPFFKSPEYQAIKNIQHTVKLQEVAIDSELLAETAKRRKKNNYYRNPSQNKSMAQEGVNEKNASATQYVQATKLFSKKIKWEWLHLVAHSILGNKSQNAANLVAGTADANTGMMFVEANVPLLAKAYPQGFELEVSANLIPNTQIATEIKYSIKTKDFSTVFTFNAQNPKKPHIVESEYLRIYFASLIAASRKKHSSAVEEELPARKKLRFS